MNKNMITGVVIIGVILLLVGAIFFFEKVPFSKVVFTVQFKDAKGLKAGDSVYVKGVKIGEVKDIGLDHQGVSAKVMIDAERNIPDDSFFFIWPDKLISGNKCIQIKIGENTRSVKKGDIINGESSVFKILFHVGKNWLKSQKL